MRREKVTKSRSILEAKGISCIPFYKALEFNPSLSSEEQALLEEQLLDAGLLDALIVSPKDYQRAKTELGSLSDSLILADADVCTGYDRLVPGEVNPELKNAVQIVINNIYDHEEEGAALVLASDGYYRNGIREGHSIPEDEASFVGAKARREKLDRMIAAKEAECKAEVTVKERIKGTQVPLRDLHLNVKKTDFQDLDYAIDMVREATYELDKASEAYRLKSEESSQILMRKKEWEQKVIANCKGLPYDRTPSAYEEALEYAGSYRDDLAELEKTTNYLDTAMSKCASTYALIEKEEETIDRTDEDLRKTERQIRLLSSEIKQIEDYLNRPEIKERAERLEKVVSTLKDKNNLRNSNREAIAGLEAIIGVRNEEIAGLKTQAVDSIERENTMRSYFREEMDLKYVMEQGNRSISECAEEAVGCMIREKDKQKDVGQVVSSLHQVYQQHSSNLAGYGTSLEDCFDDAKVAGDLRKRQIIVSTWQGRKLQLEEFYNILKESIDSTELLIREKDRALFEDILADTLSRKLSNRIAESRNWIADMSKLMQQMDTSMGLTFSLDWRPSTAEGEMELELLENWRNCLAGTENC